MTEVHGAICLATLSGFGIGCSLHRPSALGAVITACTIYLFVQSLARI